MEDSKVVPSALLPNKSSNEISELKSQFEKFFISIKGTIQILRDYPLLLNHDVALDDNFLTDDQWYEFGFLIQKALHYSESFVFQHCDLWFYFSGTGNQIWQKICYKDIQKINNQCYLKQGMLYSTISNAIVKINQMENAINMLGDSLEQKYELLATYKSAIDKSIATMFSIPRPEPRGPMLAFPFILDSKNKKSYLNFKSVDEYKSSTMGKFEQQTKFLQDYRYHNQYSCQYCYASPLALVAYHGLANHKGWNMVNSMRGSWIDIDINPIKTKVAFQDPTTKLEFVCEAVKEYYFSGCHQKDFSSNYNILIYSLYEKSKSSDHFEELILKSITEAVESYKKRDDNIVSQKERKAIVSNFNLLQTIATQEKIPRFVDSSIFTANGQGKPKPLVVSDIKIVELGKNGKKLSQKERKELAKHQQ